MGNFNVSDFPIFDNMFGFSTLQNPQNPQLENPYSSAVKPACSFRGVNTVTATVVFQRATASLTPHTLLILVACIIMIPVTAALVYIFAFSGVASLNDDDWLYFMHGPVKQVMVINRHGARTIDAQMKNDPYRYDKFWPEGIGELTKEGIIQHYLQGQWIASMYKYLIPRDPLDIHKSIRVVSTDWNRTIMSAEAELAGMFKIQDDVDSWHGLRSYLVPVRSIPENQDALLEVTKSCPRLAALLKKNIESERYQTVMRGSREVANILEYNLGAEIIDLDSYQQIYTILGIEKNRGHELGQWADSVYPNPLKELATISFAAPTWTKELKRLRGGPLIKEVIENIQRKASDPQFPSVLIYSAHDTSISAFLNSMNDMYQKEMLLPPPFAALVIVEYRQKGPKNYVRILYRCPYSKEESPDCNFVPRVLTVPGCDDVCPLERFVEILRDVTPVDWEEECRQTDHLEPPNISR